MDETISYLPTHRRPAHDPGRYFQFTREMGVRVKVPLADFLRGLMQVIGLGTVGLLRHIVYYEH